MMEQNTQTRESRKMAEEIRYEVRMSLLDPDGLMTSRKPMVFDTYAQAFVSFAETLKKSVSRHGGVEQSHDTHENYDGCCFAAEAVFADNYELHCAIFKKSMVVPILNLDCHNCGGEGFVFGGDDELRPTVCACPVCS